jgi:hypothetical protein
VNSFRRLYAQAYGIAGTTADRGGQNNIEISDSTRMGCDIPAQLPAKSPNLVVALGHPFDTTIFVTTKGDYSWKQHK